MPDIKITGKRQEPGENPAVTVYLGESDQYGVAQARNFGGPLTISLPGMIAVRIDPGTRTIAVDYRSGGGPGDNDRFAGVPWFVTDLRGCGIYGDFHQLTSRDDCNDAECAASGRHNAIYPHTHETAEDVGACQECVNRAADLRYLADA